MTADGRSYEDRACAFVEAAIYDAASDEELAQLMAEMPLDDLRVLAVHMRVLYGMTRGAWIDRVTQPRSNTRHDGTNTTGTL